MVHPDDKEGAARTAAALFADRKRGTNQFRWVARDGRTVWVEAHSTVICDETGAPVGMRGVTMDISERRRAEEALREAERLRVLAQAAVGAAHEIFQPLTAIIGQAELVLSRMASDDPTAERPGDHPQGRVSGQRHRDQDAGPEALCHQVLHRGRGHDRL
ncbi:MAG: PAS domain S-box protein [Candidatus Latescibacteria bacterium]|nr:PAS domain S-box protein [Candidatus Latescibacterota bacterium]